MKLLKIFLALIAVMILGFAFFWYSWRPEQARKFCASQNYGGRLGEYFGRIGTNYEDCLRLKGFEK